LILHWVLIDWITNAAIANVLCTCEFVGIGLSASKRQATLAVPSNFLAVSAEATSMDFPLPWRMEESSNGIYCRFGTNDADVLVMADATAQVKCHYTHLMTQVLLEDVFMRCVRACHFIALVLISVFETNEGRRMSMKLYVRRIQVHVCLSDEGLKRRPENSKDGQRTAPATMGNPFDLRDLEILA